MNNQNFKTYKKNRANRILIIFAICTLLSCSGDKSEKYIGCWRSIENKGDFLTISDNDESLIIESSRGKVIGKLESDIITLDDGNRIAIIEGSNHLLVNKIEYEKDGSVQKGSKSFIDYKHNLEDNLFSSIKGSFDMEDCEHCLFAKIDVRNGNRIIELHTGFEDNSLIVGELDEINLSTETLVFKGVTDNFRLRIKGSQNTENSPIGITYNSIIMQGYVVNNRDDFRLNRIK